MTLVHDWSNRTAVGTCRHRPALPFLAALILLAGTLGIGASAKTRHSHSTVAVQQSGHSGSKSASHAATSTRHRHGVVAAAPVSSSSRRHRHSAQPAEPVISSRHSKKHKRGAETPVVAAKRNGHARTTAHTPTTTAHTAPEIHTAALAAEPMVEPSSYMNQARIYSLYDQGLNARLLGDNQTALSRLAQLTEMLKESRLSPTMQSMAEYELGRAAERDGQFHVAIEAYERSLKLVPRYTDSSVRLSALLLRTGQPTQALMRAKEAVQNSPNDPAARIALSLVLERNGFSSDAKAERERATQLISGVGKVAEPREAPEREPEPEGEPIKPDAQKPGGTTPTGAPVPEGDLMTPGSETAPANVP